MEATVPQDKLGLVLKLGFYLFLVIVGLPLYAVVLSAAGYLIAATGATFGSGITANALSVRVFERAALPIVGLGWTRASRRHLVIGFAAGAAAAAVVTVLPLLAGMAELVPDPERPASAASILFVSVLLLFGAVGEELLFRGYGFQIVAASLGAPVALFVSSALFGYVHMSNLNASPLGIANTVAYGVVLGFAFLRAGDLWLPIGIHFGWNWVLPLAGVSLSGFRIGLTGYTLRWNVPDVWSGGAYGPEGGVLTTCVIAGLLLFLWRMPLMRQHAALLMRPKQEG